MKVNITARMLSYLAQHNVGIILCDAKHLPIGYYGDYDNHSHITKILGYQVEYTKEAYDELWKTIVAAKLLNQKKSVMPVIMMIFILQVKKRQSGRLQLQENL